MFILILTALIEAYIDDYYASLIPDASSFVSMHKAHAKEGYGAEYANRYNSGSRWNHSRNTKHGKIKRISKEARTINALS